MSRRGTLVAGAGGPARAVQALPSGGSCASDASVSQEAPGERKRDTRKHVTIGQQSTLEYDPEKPSDTAKPPEQPRPKCSYKPSRRSEIWDNKIGEIVDSSDEEAAASANMRAFEIQQPGRSGASPASDRCGDLQRCSDRCTDQCNVM
eukprot:gb/GFBE01029941.1/.p1 GENE.gb/GFBE01029941.1/~~gb/GFBE01029941.1/.p1  ORF type:complete len:148 (+),score=14.28 gb/GFBE01029941.1/:1-444(+)